MATWEQVRKHLTKNAVYVNKIIHKLIFHSDPRTRTMGVSKNLVIYSNPDFIANGSIKFIASMTLHEIMHIGSGHLERIDSLPFIDEPGMRKIANYAGDCAINCVLQNAGWEVSTGILPEKYGFPDGKTMEFYYHKFRSLPKNELEKLLSQEAGIMSGACGGVAGNPTEIEKDLPEGRSEGEVEIAIKQAHEDLKSTFGNKSGDFTDDLFVRNTPKIPYITQLRNCLRKLSGAFEAGSSDYSISFPSKRSYVRGILRPGLVTQKPEVGIVVDTSGSMDTGILCKCFGQSAGVIRSLGIDQVWFMQADVQVQSTRRLNARALTGDLLVLGRGGTSFDYAIEAMEKLRPRPNLMIYFTDSYGSISRKPRGMPLVFIVPEYYSTNLREFGKVIVGLKEDA